MVVRRLAADLLGLEGANKLGFPDHTVSISLSPLP